jgi:glyoxylase-like metal-dependent hydrolase (beta-lactamase superfamily II)
LQAAVLRNPAGRSMLVHLRCLAIRPRCPKAGGTAIREWDARKEAQWKSLFKDEWPERRTFPNRVVNAGQTVTIEGVRFTASDLGPGESHFDAYWLAETDGQKSAFVGDLVFPGEHSYVSDGHTTEWLANLEKVRGPLRGSRLYPGHGPVGGAELLDEQKAYLDRFRAEVARIAQGRQPPLSEAQKQQLTAIMSTYRPEAKLTFLIANGADAVAAELASRPSP